jgi:hypothetical protein
MCYRVMAIREIFHISAETSVKIYCKYVIAGYSREFIESNWEEVVKWWLVLYGD